MAKFFINGTPPRQTRSFVSQMSALTIEKKNNDAGIPEYSMKEPFVSSYMALDPRVVRLKKTLADSDITDSITMGYDFTMTQYKGARAEIGLSLDAIVKYFTEKDATTSDNLIFAYPISNDDTVEISTSLMEAKFLTRKKDADGKWDTVINAVDNSVVFSNNADKKEIKVFYSVSKVSGLPDTYIININGEAVQLMEDLSFTAGSHTVAGVFEGPYNYHGLGGVLIGPTMIGANEHGNGVISCPKNNFTIKPFANGELKNIGIDTSAVNLSIKTNLNWTKLDNGNLQFTWKDSADLSPKYVSLQIVQNTELDFHESTRIVMNYTAHRE
tara:strand:+ start:54 stop:1037 length:984 start_codon:yes stop_codon:yes gene_type:complete